MKLAYVQIANAALQQIDEDDRITDPDESVKAARIVKNAWEPTRLFLLSKANWSFAVRTVGIAQRADNPDWPIALGRLPYILPADLVRFVEIVDPVLDEENDLYSIENGPNGRELLVDPDAATSPITIRYVRDGDDIADPTQWTPDFIEAFTWQLAWQISGPLAADKGRKDRAAAAAAEALRNAKRANNRMKSPKGYLTTEWSAARSAGIGTNRAPNT